MAISMSRNPLLRIICLCILYCAQGIPHGFITIAMTAWLVTQGASTMGIAAIATASVLPWSFKWCWGPIVDRFQIPAYGRRRPWIIFGQSMMMMTALTIGNVSDPVENISILATLIFIHNLFGGLQDVGVDALAVDLLDPKERGRVNGLMYGSKYLGTAIGGAGLGAVLAATDLTTAILGMVTLLGMIMCVPIFIRERPGERLLPFGGRWTARLAEDASQTDEGSANHSVGELLRRLFRGFGRRSTIMAGILALMVWIPNGLTYPVSMTLFMNDLGWTQEAYSTLSGTWGVAAGITGCLVGGFAADLIGVRRLAGMACAFYAILLAAFALAPRLWWEDQTLLSVYIVVTDATQGMLTVTLFALFMSVSWRLIAATQFTAYMSMLNLSYSIGNNISPWLVAESQESGPLMDIRSIYLMAAVIQVGIIMLLPFCRPWHDEDSKSETRTDQLGTVDEESVTPGSQST